MLEGDWKPDRLVVIEFPSPDNAKAFLADPKLRLSLHQSKIEALVERAVRLRQHDHLATRHFIVRCIAITI